MNEYFSQDTRNKQCQGLLFNSAIVPTLKLRDTNMPNRQIKSGCGKWCLKDGKLNHKLQINFTFYRRKDNNI